MYKKITVISIILLAIVGVWFYITTIHPHLSLETIKFYRNACLTYSHAYPIKSRLIFGITYFILVASFLPIAALLNLLGGFLFGTLQGTFLVVTAATAGAVVNLLVVRYVFGKPLQKKYSTSFKKFNTAFKRNGINYLLFVRLAAIFPFPLINILLGLTTVSVSTYVWTTAIGIIPGTSLFVFMGKQLGTIEALSDIFTWPVMGVFLLFALISLLPVLKKSFRTNKKDNTIELPQSVDDHR